MLKFATKKPPRYKHFDQVDSSAAHLKGEGHYYGDEGESYFRGDYTRFDQVNGDDMLDYDNQNVDYTQNVAVSGNPHGVTKQFHGSGFQGHRSPNDQLREYSRKYGRGIPRDVHVSQQSPERHVGLLRNGDVGQRSDTGQRSQFNQGYIENTLENRRHTDINRNTYDQNSYGMQTSPQYSSGSSYNDWTHGGYSERSRSNIQTPAYNIHKQYYDGSNQHFQGHENPFPAPSLSTDSNGNYGLDSTASMSIDSLSASGDRSSKSTVELQDYDLLTEMPLVSRKGLEVKPPVPHRHVHVGRGTHGICEGPVSPTRPGSIESHMTSSLRKSPSGMKSGHHVRWGPGVVNSDHKHTLIPISELQPPSPTGKKGKKKTSLRNLLNLPRFPLSDDEDASDHGSSGSGHGSAKSQTDSDNRGSIRKFLDSRGGLKRKSPVAHSQPVTTTSTELASLKYKKDFLHIDLPQFSHSKLYAGKENVPKLNITKANQDNLPSFYATSLTNDFDPYVFNPDYDMLQHTDAINYPIVHSGMDQSIYNTKSKNRSREMEEKGTFNRSPVHSVRPFLINGQSSETQHFDNFEQSQKQQQNLNLINVSGRDTSNGLYPANVSSRILNEKKTPDMNARQTTLPKSMVTFDTYVTLGRPSEASVTFDTFVTLGRPFATSTPVPNGNLGYAHNLGQQFPLERTSSKSGSDFKGKGFDVTSGQSSPRVTQSWKYSAASPHSPSVPMATHAVLSSGWAPAMQASVTPGGPVSHVTSPARSPDSHVTRGPPSGPYEAPSSPYEMDNRQYGKLSMSPTTFMMISPGTSPLGSPGSNTQVPKHSNIPSNQMSQDNQRQSESHPGIQKFATDQGQQFKDKCRYKEQDSRDYDDDVFYNLGLSPADVEEMTRTSRRKLEYAGQSAFTQPVVTSCVPQVNHELNHEDTLNHNYSGYPKVQAVPGITQQKSPGTMSSNLNDMITRDRPDSGEAGCILDLVYITERIISMSFASEEQDNTYKYNLREVTRMLKTKHGDNYLVINISENKSDLGKHCPQVLDYGWPDNLAPPLERLCSICKSIDQWMSSDPNHVVVVHCKGGRGRIAVVIAAYMRYSNICASADQALDRFAMKRFYDDKLGGLPQPSQRRYVHYFAGLLSGAIQINSSALYLHHILIHGVPNFDQRGGCRPFIKVYQGMHPIFTSGVYNVTDNMQKVCISISPGIPLRGDILIKCYHKKNNAGQREIIWGCQFHTCAISHNSLVFSKNELDYGINDPRFPDPGKVEFVFGNNSEGLVQVADFKSDVTVPVDDSTEALTRWDSYENFGKMAVDGKQTDVNANGLSSSQQHGVDSFRVTQLDHSQGPVDGSLYAQVNKRKLESQIIQNGPARLQNGGSYTSSQDSVPVGSSTTHKSSSESWSYSTRDRDVHAPNLSGYSSMNKTYSASTSPRSQKVALDEQTQLDQILSDLLNDKAFVSQKSSPGGTRSFTTVEEHTNPEGNTVVQRGDVTYRVPEMRNEKHYTVKEVRSEDKSYKPVNAFSYTPNSPPPVRSPTSTYRTDYENSYKNGPSSLSDGEQSLSWLQQQQAKLREKSLERDPSRHKNEQKLIEELKKSQTQNKYFQKRSQSEDEASKSPSLPNGGTSPYSYTVTRTHYDSDKSPSESQFRPHDSLPISHSHTTYITEHTNNVSSKVSNKPPPSPSLQRQLHSPPPVPPPARTSSRDYMQQQHQTQTQTTRNRSYSGSGNTSYQQPTRLTRHNSESAYDRDHFDKQQTSRQYTTPPLSPRSVSPHTFQQYKTVYKTVHTKEDEPDFAPLPVEVKIERQTQKVEHSVKPPAPPPQDINKPHYITEVIVQRTGGSDSKNSTLNRNEQMEKRDTDNRLDALEKSLQAASQSIMQSTPYQQQQVQQQQFQQQQQQQNFSRQEVRQYETRSYETKSENRQEQRSENRQEQRFEQQSVSNGGFPRSMSSPTWDNIPSEPFQNNAEQVKKLEVTEEDRIVLKPIGPGVQQLEPEGSTLGRDSTLGRATTPNFPTSPQSAEQIIQAVHEKVRRMSIGSNQSLNSIGYQGYVVTPPFPVTPKTPYQNLTVSTGPYQLYQQGSRPQTSPFGYGSSVTSGHQYSSQQSLNSVFEREREDPNSYNSIVSRQLMRSVNDPTYASINDSTVGNVRGGSHVTSPMGTLQSDKMQYQTGFTQNQQYQTLPSNMQTFSQSSYESRTLPHQSSYQQQQQLQQQQQQQQQQQYQQQQYQQKQQYQTSSNYQYSTNSHSQQHSHDGSLHVDTNPRMLMTQSARSPSASSPGSPPSPGNLNTLRQQLHTAHNMSSSAVSPGPHSATGQSSPSVYFGLSRRGSLTSLADSEAMHTTPRFVKDTSKYWYKPNITREEAIMLLKDKAPGTFVVRDSNSFPGAFGLALKVATLPPNVQTKSTGDPMADLVRHFLIEPTSKGVRLRGCSNEPVFGSLASLVYQHSITPLALPCKLVLPEHDQAHIVTEVSTPTSEMQNTASQLLAQGAACNVLYLNSVDTESLTGPQAVSKACKVTFDNPPSKTTHVHFKVSNQGITLTDNQRKLFFRRHYPVAAVTYCGADPEDRKWRRDTDMPGVQADARVFGFVARKQGSVSDNCCHLFAELDPDQPAGAIVNFVTKIMIGQAKIKS